MGPRVKRVRIRAWRVMAEWLLLLWAAWAMPACATELLLDDAADGYRSAAHHVTVWRDGGGSADLDAARAADRGGKFRPANGVTSFGFDAAPHWFRLDLRRPANSPGEWWIEVPYPGLDDVRLYAPDGAGYGEAVRVGDRRPFAERPMRHRYFIFPVNLPADRVATFYLRVQTADTLTVPIRIWRPDRFASADTGETLLIGTYYGLILAMLVYNLFLYIKLRDPLYLYYLAFSASVLIVVAELNGHNFQYLWPNNLWLADRQHVIFPAAALWATLLFTRRFFDLEATAPRLDRLLRALLGYLLLAVLIGVTVNYSLGHMMMFPAGLMTMLIGLAAGVGGILRGYRPAVYFLAAELFYQAAVGVVSANGLGWWSTEMLIQQVLGIGSALEVILFSVALAERIAVLRQEKEAALRRAVEAEQKIIDVGEETQRKVGQELHDDLGQHLTGIAFLSKVLSNNLESKGLAEAQEAVAITGLVNQAVSKTRLLARGLYPVELEEGGLAAALDRLAKSVKSIFDVECEIACDEACLANQTHLAINLFRIVQEAVGNAIKHGKARHVTIELAEQNGQNRLVVSDDGKGFDPESTESRGLGLASMRYRAQRFGARLEMRPRPEGGMQVFVTWPVAGMS